jgi:hypothetical protein
LLNRKKEANTVSATVIVNHETHKLEDGSRQSMPPIAGEKKRRYGGSLSSWKNQGAVLINKGYL